MDYPKYAEDTAADVVPGSLLKHLAILQERIDLAEHLVDGLGEKLRLLRVVSPVPPMEKFEESGACSSLSNQVAGAAYRIIRIEVNLRLIIDELDL